MNIPSRIDMIETTSVVDGRTHMVTADEFDTGIWKGEGVYRAMCGRDVVVAALVEAPGPQCPECPPRPGPYDTDADGARWEWLRAALARLLPGLRKPSPGTGP